MLIIITIFASHKLHNRIEVLFVMFLIIILNVSIKMITQSSSPNWYSMSDPAIAFELCATLKEIRLQQNLTQEQLAEKAGLSRSAISKMEIGKSTVSLITVIQVLRVLQQLHLFDNWKVAAKVSPIKVAKLSAKSRLRASRKEIKKNQEESEW